MAYSVEGGAQRLSGTVWQADATLQDGEKRYRQLFDAIDVGFCVIEMIFDETGRPADYRFIEVNAAFEHQTGLKNATEKTMREHEPAHEDHWFETYGRIALSGQSERFEAPARALGHIYEVFAFSFDDPAMRRVGVLFKDVSERKRAEETQLMLTAELNHRVKNTLSIVSSIARQSMKGVDEAKIDTFLDRVAALGQAHELLSIGHWRSASLYGLASKVIAPYRTSGNNERISITGPDLALSPQATQSLTLGLHELATNAAKYGALSVEGGRVDIEWQTGEDADPQLIFSWIESGGPRISAPPSRTGFGTRLLKQALAFQLGGDINIAYHPTGLAIRLEIPLKKLLA